MTSIEWEIIKSKLVPVTAREGKRICPEKVLYFNAELKTSIRISFWKKKYVFAVNRMQMIVKLYMLSSQVVVKSSFKMILCWTLFLEKK